MLKIAIRNILARKLRFFMTAIAIVLGTAMISGTYVLTDQINGAFDDIFQQANTGTDVIVSKKMAFDSQTGAQSEPIAADVVERIQHVPGVDQIEGSVSGTGSLVVDGKSVTSLGGAPALLVSDSGNKQFNALTYVKGARPSTAGQIAVDQGSASKNHLIVGQRVKVATRTGLHPATLTGVFKFAGASSLGGTLITVTTLGDAQKWLNMEGQITQVAVSAQSGTSADALRDRIRDTLDSPQYLVETGQQNADRQAEDIQSGLSIIRNTLFVFAAIAILVGGFVIFNVFSITIAQRVREMAMLRTIGARRSQIMRRVVIEALIIGLVASIIGIFVGVLLAMGLKAMLDAFDIGLPSAGISIHAKTVIVPLAVGIVATLLAALIPAIRATHIAPVAALREGAVIPRSRLHRYTPWIGLGALVIGLVITLVGVNSDGTVTRVLGTVGVGLLLVLFGMGAVMRLLIRPLATAIGAPISAIFGQRARLGRQNAARDTTRTASTAAALMIGIGLVVFVAVFTDGIKTSFFDAIDRTIQADQIIMDNSFQPLPAGAVQTARDTPGIASVLGVGTVETRIDGRNTSLSAIDPGQASEIVRFDWRDGGSDALLSKLTGDGALVEQGYATDHGISIGDHLTLHSIYGSSAGVNVVGIYHDPQIFTGVTIGDGVYRRLTDQPDVSLVLAKMKPGADLDATTAALKKSFQESYPTGVVRTRAEYRDFISGQLNQILGIFYVLLALSIIISLVGVIITLLLAVYERTREIGMMRAVGATRGQIRSMITFESVITAIIGAIVGLVLGLILGYVMIKGLESQGLSFSVPVGTLITVLVMAVLAGLLAAIIPARRAAKLQPLEALHYE